MISTTVLLSAFNGNDIPDAFYHAEHSAFLMNWNKWNKFSIRNIKATLAELYFATHFSDHFAELPDHIHPALLKQHQAQSCFLPMPKFGKFINSIFQQEEENCIAQGTRYKEFKSQE
jgi:hypothetical protein